jgi:hypothetical protein
VKAVDVVGCAVVVPPYAEEREAASAKVRKTMSRSAQLAAIACKEALAAAGWTEGRETIGYHLGVGASGGPLAEVIAMFDASVEDGALSMAKLGDAGLRACNPMFTFQVLNNFAMCHGAILEGLGGPNGAWFSRGSGTVGALAEAVHAIGDGDCDRCLAGGADSALHPVTIAELDRTGFISGGLVPAEGAAVLALATPHPTLPPPGGGKGGPSPTDGGGSSFSLPPEGGGLGRGVRPIARIEAVKVWPGRALPLAAAVEAAVSLWPAPEAVVVTGWGEGVKGVMGDGVRRVLGSGAKVEGDGVVGETLAAGPALGWAKAIDLIRAGATRVLCLSAGTDGDLGAVLIGSPA